jgi:O-succinylbenzoic acid--CoA ligase
MVTVLDHIPGPVGLDGRTFSVGELIEYASEQSGSSANPPWRKDVFSFLARFLDPEQAAIIQHTSGTTGKAKSFALSRDAMISSARRTLDFFGLKKGDRALLCLPVHYIAGKMMVVRALLGGMDLIIREPSSRPLRDVQDNIAFAAMVPMQMEETIRHGDPIDRISTLLLGGGELHPATRDKLASMIMPEVYETFGMTETYTHFALKRINGHRPDNAFNLMQGVQIFSDERGCLVVDIPGVTTGRVATNDLVEINPQGDGFIWKGRFDNLINTGGIKILPEPLEEKIQECLGHECLVLPEADRKLGSRLVLMVEFRGKQPPLDSWMSLLRERLSAYEVPKRIVTVESLPRNPSMKPDRTSARGFLL